MTNDELQALCDATTRWGVESLRAREKLGPVAIAEFRRLLAEKKADAETIAALTARVAELEGAGQALRDFVDKHVHFVDVDPLIGAWDRATLKARSDGPPETIDGFETWNTVVPNTPGRSA